MRNSTTSKITTRRVQSKELSKRAHVNMRQFNRAFLPLTNKYWVQKECQRPPWHPHLAFFVWKFHENSIPSEPKPCILEGICPNLKSRKVINSAGIGQANMRTVPKSLSVNFFDPSDLKPITSLPSESSELPRLVELGVGAKVLVGQQAPKKFSSRRLWCFNLDDAIMALMEFQWFFLKYFCYWIWSRKKYSAHRILNTWLCIQYYTSCWQIHSNTSPVRCAYRYM